MTTRRTSLLCTTILALAATAHAEDWPQWRGPALTGISGEAGWSPTGRTEDVWSKAVGLGYSCFSISGGKLYTMGYDVEKEIDTIYCLDADTGKEIWSHSYPAEIMNRAHRGGTVNTPSVDGDLLWALNREGKLFCFDAAGGEIKWQRNMEEELELERPTWGYAGSPLILDDMVVLNLGKIVAMKKVTGEIMWTSDDTGHAYSTPVPVDLPERKCFAVFNSNGLALLDRGDGEVIDVHEWKTQYDINAATPVLIDGDKVFISSSFNRGCALLKCTADGLEVVWESKVMRTKMSGCILWEGHLYGFDDALLKCIDLEGNEKWQVRGIGNGSHMIADGRLIVISGKGELIIAEATPEGFTELSREKCLHDEGVYWTMPILVDGRIYCRSSEGALVCRDHRGGAGTGNE